MHLFFFILEKQITYDENNDDDDFEMKVRSCLQKVFIYVYINATNYTNNTFGKLDIKKVQSGIFEDLKSL